MEAKNDDSPPKVVVIEDEVKMVQLMTLILEQREFEILTATGGKEGLALVAKELPDLVLLDLMMPDMDGWEVYKLMKADENMREIPVIVVTAKAANADQALGRIAKVDDYITKPFSPTELLSAIDKVT